MRLQLLSEDNTDFITTVTKTMRYADSKYCTTLRLFSDVMFLRYKWTTTPRIRSRIQSRFDRAGLQTTYFNGLILMVRPGAEK